MTKFYPTKVIDYISGHINRLIQQQKLSFDYQFYQKDFDMKINTIIISEGQFVYPALNDDMKHFVEIFLKHI